MRTIIDGLAFAKAVAHVSKTLIAGQRQAVRLAATGDGLRLDADGQYYSRADLDAETVEDGSAVVNGFWLSSVAAVMPSEELNVETADSKLRLDCRGIVMELPLIDDPAAEPNVPTCRRSGPPSSTAGSPRGRRRRPRRRQGLQQSRAVRRPRPRIGRLHRTVGHQPVRGGHRPRRRLRRHGRAGPGPHGSRPMRRARTASAPPPHVRHRRPVYTDATPMVEGQAPVLAAIWPSKDAPLTLTMDRAELLEAARRVKAVKFSGGETVTLALAVGDDSITLGLDDAESGSGARQTVSAEVSGPVVDGHVEGAGRRLRLDARYCRQRPAAPSMATA